MRSGLPSSSSPLPVKVAFPEDCCWCGGGLGLEGVAACLLHNAISTPVTINPKPVAVPPSPIRIGDMSIEDEDEDEEGEDDDEDDDEEGTDSPEKQNPR